MSNTLFSLFVLLVTNGIFTMCQKLPDGRCKADNNVDLDILMKIKDLQMEFENYKRELLQKQQEQVNEIKEDVLNELKIARSFTLPTGT